MSSLITNRNRYDTPGIALTLQPAEYKRKGKASHNQEDQWFPSLSCEAFDLTTCALCLGSPEPYIAPISTFTGTFSLRKP